MSPNKRETGQGPGHDMTQRSDPASPRRGGKGFRRGAALIEPYVARASETRGFAVSRLLTHWRETVGSDVADICRPAEISYGRKALGATLTLETTGAFAPQVQAQSEAIRVAVNACYGYAAIARIRIRQVGPESLARDTGLARTHGRGAAPGGADQAEVTAQARSTVGEISDPGLRSALEALARNILTRR